MRGIIVAVGMALVGCARSPEPLVFSYQGSEAGLAKATTAAEEWNTVCGTSVIVGRDRRGVPFFEMATPARDIDRGVTIMNAGHPEAVGVWVDAPLETYTHEIGHALGIEAHAATGVMAVSATPGSHVTAADCAMLPER